MSFFYEISYYVIQNFRNPFSYPIQSLQKAAIKFGNLNKSSFENFRFMHIVYRLYAKISKKINKSIMEDVGAKSVRNCKKIRNGLYCIFRSCYDLNSLCF
jgi:hypothetical protein